ncbi:hypothetical protein FEM03_05600 [Phragmitibacter flavus]|uniref:PQQ-like beta-propeller repeat protein n=1 Tax=Phragmitibacter flavus TaxID=2576071 RepID=A0A5R8KH30_9BACT|nr:PQQ-binding-like beta-propeller repeat protein [Phragmitibacter flavus]TLD71616.1 hypothetical protein FEM03_05600 [Phragmitibacter flavus]
MSLAQLVFVGFNKNVAALDRHSGTIVWEWRAAKGSSYVTLHLDRDLLIVAVDGYMYGLDAMTGEERWFNPMSGYGTGVTSIASVSGSVGNLPAAAAQTYQQQQQNDQATYHHSS